jgi:tetratricopeptide (TPR) repeat protein
MFVLLSSAAGAQTWPENGFSLSGEVHGGRAAELSHLFVELYDAQSHSPIGRAMLNRDGSFRFDNLHPGSYSFRVVAAPGDDPLVEEFHQVQNANEPITLQLRESRSTPPISGVVSVRELAHPVPKQAVRAAAEAQRYSSSHDTAKAIVKLEEAVTIAPDYRDAHTNLGVQYIRAGRVPEGMAHFQRALEIGPADAIIYSNLALGYALLGQFREVEAWARKAIALDAGNTTAQALLRYALRH